MYMNHILYINKLCKILICLYVYVHKGDRCDVQSLSHKHSDLRYVVAVAATT
jgi:hypothetical protein